MKRITITVDRNNGPTTRDDIDGERGEKGGVVDTDGNGSGLAWRYAVDGIPTARADMADDPDGAAYLARLKAAGKLEAFEEFCNGKKGGS